MQTPGDLSELRWTAYGGPPPPFRAMARSSISEFQDHAVALREGGRQWVLSLPFAIRYKMAWDHELELKVLRIFWRCVEKHYRKKAKVQGLSSARTGGVTSIQRAGGAFNLNPHFHTAVLDGVFIETENGTLKFHQLGTPTTEEVVAVTMDVRKRVLKMLGRDSVSFEEEDGWNDDLLEEFPALAAASMASVHQLIAFGQRAGCRVSRLIDPTVEPTDGEVESRRKRHTRYQGFDLHVGAAVPGQDRHRLERLLRYLLRPPIAESRLKELPSGQILLKLKNRWRDGTMSIVFEPIEFLELCCNCAACCRIAIMTDGMSIYKSKSRGDHPPAPRKPDHLSRSTRREIQGTKES